MLNLRRLHHAIALGEEQQFARAAARVHLSQPAFSRSIATLEAELGAPLFDRRGAQVTPSALGQVLLTGARQLLAQARQLEEDFAQQLDGQSGVIRFGMGSVVALHLLPSLLAQIRQRFPRVQVQVEQNASAQLAASLQAQQIDFFIAELRSVPPLDEFRLDPLVRAPLTCIARAQHPLAGQPCTLAQVWAHGVCAVGLGELARQRVADALGCAPQALALSVQCNSHLSLVDLVLQSDTVLLSTAESVRAQLQAGSLRVLDVQPALDLNVSFGVVSLAGRSLSPVATQVMQMVLALGETMADAPPRQAAPKATGQAHRQKPN